jgi:hypothetical protein
LVRGEAEQLVLAATACHGAVLIAWQREDIPTIADAILGKRGFVTSKWPANFDLVWIPAAGLLPYHG